MKTVILNFGELKNFVQKLQPSFAVGMLLAGDRLSCCDEAAALEIEKKIVGVATIAPLGEERSGQPTIVALYVLPEHRQKGCGKQIFEAAIQHCVNRGFLKIRVDVMSAYVHQIIRSLPDNLREVLEVVDHGDIMDRF